jgi:hypothetical protein
MSRKRRKSKTKRPKKNRASELPIHEAHAGSQQLGFAGSTAVLPHLLPPQDPPLQTKHQNAARTKKWHGSIRPFLSWLLASIRKWAGAAAVFLLVTSWTMIQIDEYLLGEMTLVAALVAFGFQIYDWRGIERHVIATRMVRITAGVTAIAMVGFFGVVVVKKKGPKAWSNLVARDQQPQIRAQQSSPKAWLELSDEQMAKFIGVLRSHVGPQEQIKLGCAAYSEQTCVASAKFLDAFKRSGWPVLGDKIERVVPAKPIAGVALFKYGHADAFDPQDPDQGKWMELSQSLSTLQRAFAEVGIAAVRLADEQLPKETIGVFFGIDPSSEASKTPHDFFQEDFSNLPRFPKVRALKFENHPPINIEYQMYLDFDARVTHLGHYIPFTTETYNICARIADGVHL